MLAVKSVAAELQMHQVHRKLYIESCMDWMAFEHKVIADRALNLKASESNQVTKVYLLTPSAAWLTIYTGLQTGDKSGVQRFRGESSNPYIVLKSAEE